jgi:hypothetical protein
MKRLAIAVLLAACSKESEMLPIGPGGGAGSGGEFRPDASMEAGDASPFITGRVCFVLTSLRNPTACSTDAGEFTVRLGSAMTQTAADGSFTLMRPANPNGLVWLVSRGDAITSAIKLGGTTTLPALEATAYEEMIAATQPVLADGDGAMMVRVTKAGAAVTGATIATVPAPTSDVYYDGPTDVAWETDATGGFGVAWIPSAPVGSTNVTITAGQAMATSNGQPVLADTITFVFAEIP